jgi:TolB-like protein/DNA-binding winged helix-turn-helix (wHTH) protein/Flp pilus assembly protein TadD
LTLPAHTVRFGPFQLDLRSAELRSHGTTVKLAEQPFQILVELTQHPGEVVTREELRERLWHSDTFVDFEHGLNMAVKRLREALGDSADSPRFIETLPRRGYRLIVPVEGPDSAVEQKGQIRSRNWTRWQKWAVITVGTVIAIAGVGTWYARSRATPRIQSLAVLPVRNYSGDPSQEFFADGMTDALVAGLARIEAVKVISTTSAMHYKGTNETLPQIARELGVDALVEASVTRSGDRVRLTVQLIDARDRHLWAGSYERQMTDVLALQSDLVQAIAVEIQAHVTPQESARLKTTRRVDPEVYDTTLRAKAVLEYATRREQFDQAIELFQKAIDRDPTYAPAWAGLGESLWNLAGALTGNEWVAPAEVRDKAIAAADKALELDPNLPDAHKARAVIAVDGEWDFVRAQEHFEKALELRPGYASARILYAEILAVPLQRYGEARRQCDRARELDPLSPWNDTCLLLLWAYQGQWDKELEVGEWALKRDPTMFWIRFVRAGARVGLGQPDQAVPDLEATLSLLQPERPPVVLAALGEAYALAGRKADALKILTEMELTSQKRYVSAFNLATVYASVGRMDEAFRFLDRALEQRAAYLFFCSPYDPFFFVFRHDRRWKPFVERLRAAVRLPPGTPNPYF